MQPRQLNFLGENESGQQPVRHLTMTGYYAGRPICGAARREGDIYQHYYLTYSIEHLTDLCPECKKIYERMESA